MIVRYPTVNSDTQVQTSARSYSRVLTSSSLSFLRTQSQGLDNRALVITTWDSERKALAHSLGYGMGSMGSHCYHCHCWHFVSHGRLEAFDGHYLAVVTPDCRIPVHHFKGFGGLRRLAFLKCFWLLVYWSLFSLVRLTRQRWLKEGRVCLGS